MLGRTDRTYTNENGGPESITKLAGDWGDFLENFPTGRKKGSPFSKNLKLDRSTLGNENLALGNQWDGIISLALSAMLEM